MRKTTAIGASLLLAAGLAAGLTAPASAQPVLPATGGWGSHDDHKGDKHKGDKSWGDKDWGNKDWGDGHWQERLGDHWDGGSGYYDGKRYDWPEGTRSYDANVCPDMDLAKTDVREDLKTITLIAPEGKLISAYCVKAGSAKRGEGPKIVELDEPQAEVTIFYSAAGKCRDISHYSVAYVDEQAPPPATSTPTPSAPPAETPAPEPLDNPGDEETDEPTVDVPTPSTPDTPDEGDDTTDGTEVVFLPEPTPSASEAAAATEDSNNSSGQVTRTVIEGAPVAAQANQLAMTGPQIAAVALAALALVGVGVGAVMAARRRREQQA